MLVMCTLRFAHADGGEHLVEQHAGAADERLALQIFLATRRLADDHQARALGAAIEAQVFCRGAQTAALETAEQGAKLRKRARAVEICSGSDAGVTGARAGN